MYWFLWFLISIAFWFMLVFTIVRIFKKRSIKKFIITTVSLFVVGFLLFFIAAYNSDTDEDYNSDEYRNVKVSKKEKEAYQKGMEEESDKDDLKSAIKDKLNDTSKLKSIAIYDNNVVITLKGQDNLTKGLILKGMNQGIADTLLGIKDTSLNYDSIKINVEYKNNQVIKSEWGKENVVNMSNSTRTNITNNPEQYAIKYWKSPAFN